MKCPPLPARPKDVDGSPTAICVSEMRQKGYDLLSNAKKVLSDAKLGMSKALLEANSLFDRANEIEAEVAAFHRSRAAVEPGKRGSS